MSHLDRLAQEFRRQYLDGAHPDAAEFLDRAPSGDRQELGQRIRAMLER